MNQYAVKLKPVTHMLKTTQTKQVLKTAQTIL